MAYLVSIPQRPLKSISEDGSYHREKKPDTVWDLQSLFEESVYIIDRMCGYQAARKKFIECVIAILAKSFKFLGQVND